MAAMSDGPRKPKAPVTAARAYRARALLMEPDAPVVIASSPRSRCRAQVAAAQPGPDDPTPPGMTPPIKPPPAPESPLDLADHRDAAADRAFGSSTALVVPRGTVDLSVRFGKGGLIGSAAVELGSSAELSADLAGGDGRQ